MTEGGIQLRTLDSLAASVSRPFAWWSFADDGAPTVAKGSISALAAAGTQGHAARPGWWTADGSGRFYTAPTYLEPALKDVFDLGENIVLVWAQVNVAQGVDTSQDYLLQVGSGGSQQWSWAVSRTSTASSGKICTHLVNVAFSGAAIGFGGGSNTFDVNVDANILALLDNRVGEKRVYLYADGVQFGSAMFSGNGACDYSSAPTARLRVGASAAASPANLYLGALRRFGAANFGQTMPRNINQIIRSLHTSGCVPSLALLRALQ